MILRTVVLLTLVFILSTLSDWLSFKRRAQSVLKPLFEWGERQLPPADAPGGTAPAASLPFLPLRPTPDGASPTTRATGLEPVIQATSGMTAEPRRSDASSTPLHTLEITLAGYQREQRQLEQEIRRLEAEAARDPSGAGAAERQNQLTRLRAARDTVSQLAERVEGMRGRLASP